MRIDVHCAHETDNYIWVDWSLNGIRYNAHKAERFNGRIASAQIASIVQCLDEDVQNEVWLKLEEKIEISLLGSEI